MRKHNYCSVILALTGAVAATNAKEPTDEVATAIMRSAPDVASWESVAKGFYRGVASDGAVVKIFFGPEGAKIALAEVADELHVAAQEFESLAKNKTLDAESAKKLNAVEGRIVALQLERGRLLEVVESDDAASAKATRTYSDLELHCGGGTYFNSSMSATSSGAGTWTGVQASGTWDVINSVPIGPPPPLPYFSERSLQVSIFQGSNSWQASDLSQDPSAVVAATITQPTVVNQCAVRVRQAIRWKCLSTSSISYGGLQRDNTCSGIIANTPPTVIDL